jgi:hypothetical protein
MDKLKSFTESIVSDRFSKKAKNVFKNLKTLTKVGKSTTRSNLISKAKFRGETITDKKL